MPEGATCRNLLQNGVQNSYVFVLLKEQINGHQQRAIEHGPDGFLLTLGITDVALSRPNIHVIHSWHLAED